jgi:hypothetical protein
MVISLKYSTKTRYIKFMAVSTTFNVTNVIPLFLIPLTHKSIMRKCHAKINPNALNAMKY